MNKIRGQKSHATVSLRNVMKVHAGWQRVTFVSLAINRKSQEPVLMTCRLSFKVIFVPGLLSL
jgi:hypothetical protein